MASGKVKTLTDETFDVATRDGLVLVDFWAEWCAPCRALAPTVDAIADEFEGRATVAKLNIDDHPRLPARFNIRSIPTLLLFRDGEVQEMIVGVSPKARIAQAIESRL